MISKQSVIVLVLICLSLACLFADPMVSRDFKLTHTINVDSRFNFYFKSTEGDNPIITSVELNPLHPRFARFGISLNWRVAFSSILLAFSPLVHTIEETVYYDYVVSIVEPHSDTQLVSTTPNPIGHGACSAEFAPSNNGIEFEKTIAGPQQDIDIADFLITLDDSTALAGQYQGSIVCTFSAR